MKQRFARRLVDAEHARVKVMQRRTLMTQDISHIEPHLTARHVVVT
jgi:hypothetical protein